MLFSLFGIVFLTSLGEIALARVHAHAAAALINLREGVECDTLTVECLNHPSNKHDKHPTEGWVTSLNTSSGRRPTDVKESMRSLSLRTNEEGFGNISKV